MKPFIGLIGLILISGCTSMQQSVYTNESTPYGNKVYATGNAAVEAAGASHTYNCPSCAVSGQRGNQQYPRYRYNRKNENEFEKIYNSGKRTLTREISNSVNDAIRDVFK